MIIGSALPSLPMQFLGANGPTSEPTSGSFGDVLHAAIGNVDGLQGKADSQIGNLLQGSSDADVGNVMVSVEKADVAFQLMMQVRNKVVSAYQEIEKMQF